MIAFGVFPLFLPLAIAAFGGPEGYLSLAIIAFGAFQFIVPKYDYRLGKWNLRSLDSLFKEVTVFKVTKDSLSSPSLGHLLTSFWQSRGNTGVDEMDECSVESDGSKLFTFDSNTWMRSIRVVIDVGTWSSANDTFVSVGRLSKAISHLSMSCITGRNLSFNFPSCSSSGFF